MLTEGGEIGGTRGGECCRGGAVEGGDEVALEEVGSGGEGDAVGDGRLEGGGEGGEVA